MNFLSDLVFKSSSLCRQQSFYNWLMEIRDPDAEMIVTPNHAAQVIFAWCSIDSFTELDHDKEAARIFREQIMAPFNAWKIGNWEELI